MYRDSLDVHPCCIAAVPSRFQFVRQSCHGGRYGFRARCGNESDGRRDVGHARDRKSRCGFPAHDDPASPRCDRHGESRITLRTRPAAAPLGARDYRHARLRGRRHASGPTQHDRPTTARACHHGKSNRSCRSSSRSCDCFGYAGFFTRPYEHGRSTLPGRCCIRLREAGHGHSSRTQGIVVADRSADNALEQSHDAGFKKA